MTPDTTVVTTVVTKVSVVVPLIEIVAATGTVTVKLDVELTEGDGEPLTGETVKDGVTGIVTGMLIVEFTALVMTAEGVGEPLIGLTTNEGVVAMTGVVTLGLTTIGL